MTGLRRRLNGIAVLAFLSGIGVFLVMINGQHNNHRGAYAGLTLAIGWGFIGTGLYVCKRRPGNNVGWLMIAVGFSGFLKGLTFSNDSVVFTVSSLGEVLIYALLVHLLLAFPSGRLESQLDRFLVAIAYFNTTVVHLAVFVFSDPTTQGCPQCPANPLLINHPEAAATVSATQVDIAVAVLGAVVAVLYRHWRASTPTQGRAFTPVLTAGGLTFVLLMTQLIVAQANLSSQLADALTLALLGSLACLPFAFALGIVRSRLDQAEAINSLVGVLGGGGGRGVLRNALAAALGDDTLQLAYWVPSRRGFVDAKGQPMQVDPPPEGRVATTIDHDGRRIAAIVHAANLAEEPGLVQTVGAAAALTLENERLEAELRATVAELRASRARIVHAGDEQRRRIERDLHDGAQQRLMALGINLRLLRDRIEHDPDDAIELLDASLQELSEATAELRELARGIHPAVLTDRGLADALNALARRSPVPVEVLETPCDRLPPSIESAAYFVVAEALTNAARYAIARSVTVSVVRRDSQVEIDVTDDGVGGADPEQGSGLRGLHDRVAALDGQLDLASGASQGTTLRARIPCG